MRFKRHLPLWAVLYALGLLIPLGAAAQGSGIHIHETPDPQQVTTASGAVGLSLQPSFSLLDSENQVMMAFEVESATIELEGNSFPALIQELDTPWTIVLLVDASRTMGGFAAAATFKNVRNTISSAIGGVPENTNIALLTFDDGVQTQLEFTQETDAVKAALRGVNAKSFGNSCLNNGLSEAVNKLSGAPGRRAVIVFTASADDCATRTTQEVVDLALRNGVQIYPVGLLGYTITQDALSALADPTGGLSELKDEGTLGFGFSNIMAVLNNQWTARATIYPSAGEQQAILTINLKDETVLTSPPITFVSAQDYVPPAEIYLKGNVQSTGEGILFNLDIVQAAVIRQLNVSIISKETGQSVLAQALISFSDVNALPAVGLIPGAEYSLIVNAIDAQGRVLSEASAEFKYEPPPAQLSITQVQEPTAEQESFRVIVSSQNVGGAVKHKAWLMEVESQVLVDGTEVTIPLGEPILIP
ncbi:MAG: VWA domain-containing protein, partial [Anaerolineales bacterium]